MTSNVSFIMCVEDQEFKNSIWRTEKTNVEAKFLNLIMEFDIDLYDGSF